MMRATLLTFVLIAVACGDDHWPGVWANGEPFAECVPPPAEAPCVRSGRSFALAVCGGLTADNTLTVAGASADVALWVRDAAITRSPLKVQGAYWSGSNQATNTQDIAGAVQTGATAPSCASTLSVRTDSRWDVRIDEPADVVLEGCSYAQPNLQVDNTLDVHIRGDVVWVIETDLRIAAPLRVTVEPGSHLEWTIAGSLDIDNTLTVEGPTTLQVGGPIHVAAPLVLDGSLVAPNSRLDVDNTVEISGAAYVGALRVASPMRVDGSTLLREDGCAP